jgi:hypothetical protein
MLRSRASTSPTAAPVKNKEGVGGRGIHRLSRVHIDQREKEGRWTWFM